MKRAAVVLPLVASVALLGFTAAQDSATLEFKFKPGEKLTIKSVANTDMAISGAMDAEGTTKTTTTNVTTFTEGEDGWVAFTTTTPDVQSESTMEVPGMDAAQMTELMKTVKITGETNPKGKTRNFKIEGDPMVTGGMEADPMSNLGFMGVTLPEGSAKVGDTWQATADIKPGEGGSAGGVDLVSGKTTMDYKLDSFETVEGATIAVISFTVKGDIVVAGPMGDGSMKITGNGKIHFDANKGMPVKAEQTIKNAMDLGIVMIEQSSKTTSTFTKS